MIKQGQIRLYGIDQGDNTTTWSEKFSLDVIKSTGMASCKVPNDRIYMVNKQTIISITKYFSIQICVDIVTSSFGLTKLVTLSPSVVIINKSTVC